MSSRRSRFPQWVLLALAPLVASAGCAGAIDGGGDSPIEPEGPGVTGGTGGKAPATPTPMGSGGAGGGGMMTPAKPNTPSTPPVSAACMTAALDPGPAIVRRLTRFEYNNTVRDLGLPFGTNEPPASSFPNEERRNGFDNNAEALTVSPLLSE